MNPVVGGIVAKAGEAALDVAKENGKNLLQKLLGPWTEAVGESWAIGQRERMYNNLVEVAARADKKLKEAGVSPQQVSLKIIHPMLEHARLEEDPGLQELWANLMANAADPRCVTDVPALFTSVLSTLGPREAGLLDALYPEGQELHNVPRTPLEVALLYTDAGLSGGVAFATASIAESGMPEIVQAWNRFSVSLQTLLSHGLLEAYQTNEPFMLDLNRFAAGQLSTKAFKIDVQPKVIFRRTALGKLFMAACRPPK